MSTKLVILVTEKDGEIKARLVSHDFGEEFPLLRDSPTVSKGQ